MSEAVATEAVVTAKPETTGFSGAVVKLESQDGKVLEVPVELAKMSVTIKNMLDGTHTRPRRLKIYTLSYRYRRICCTSATAKRGLEDAGKGD